MHHYPPKMRECNQRLQWDSSNKDSFCLEEKNTVVNSINLSHGNQNQKGQIQGSHFLSSH